MSDQKITDLLMRDLLPIAHPEFANARVVDSEVRRYPGSVSFFYPGSFRKRPPLETSVQSIVCAGDWVRMGDKEHGAKGLCQERVYSGRRAPSRSRPCSQQARDGSNRSPWSETAVVQLLTSAGLTADLIHC